MSLASQLKDAIIARPRPFMGEAPLNNPSRCGPAKNRKQECFIINCTNYIIWNNAIYRHQITQNSRIGQLYE
jgi:hypothetical protein